VNAFVSYSVILSQFVSKA